MGIPLVWPDKDSLRGAGEDASIFTASDGYGATVHLSSTVSIVRRFEFFGCLSSKRDPTYRVATAILLDESEKGGGLGMQQLQLVTLDKSAASPGAHLFLTRPE